MFINILLECKHNKVVEFRTRETFIYECQCIFDSDAIRWVNRINHYIEQSRIKQYNDFYGNLPSSIISFLHSKSIKDIDKDFAQHRDKTLRIIINPHGGNGTAMEIYNQIACPLLQSSGIKTKLEITSYSGHAYTMGLNHNPINYEGVILVGGDGLINEFVNGIMARKDAMIILGLTHIFLLFLIFKFKFL